MSLMSSRVGLTDRCTIERANTGKADGWNNPGAPKWEPHLEDQPCRAWTETGTEVVDTDKTAALSSRRLSIPLGTDVTEKDRVASVTRRGSEFFDGPMDIHAVLPFDDHLELILERVR